VQTVPSVTLVTPQVFATQVLVVHSLPSSAQSVGSTHPTQAPDPLHTPPVQGVPEGWFAVPQVPALQVGGAVHSLPSSAQSPATTH
jgi:hypothetical protein